MTPFQVSSGVSGRVGIFSYAFMAYGTAVVRDGQLCIAVDCTQLPSMAEINDASADAIVEKARAELRKNAEFILQGNLDVSSYFYLAGYSGESKDWRIKDSYGWVNGLDEAGYEGRLVCTNGMLGITRTAHTTFKLHQMSHWVERKAGRAGVGTRIARPKKAGAKAKAALDDLLADL
jgi:hypothetical protein